MGKYYVIKGNATAAAPYTTMYTAAADLDTAVAYFQANGTEDSTIFIADSETHTTGATEAGALPFALTIVPATNSVPTFTGYIRFNNVLNKGITIDGLIFNINNLLNPLCLTGAAGETFTVKNCTFYNSALSRAVNVTVAYGDINIYNNLFIQCKYAIEDMAATVRTINIYNNTFYSTVFGSGHIALVDSGATVNIFSNIFHTGAYSIYANDAAPITTVNCNYNCHYTITDLYLGNVTVAGKVGELTDNPKFKNIYREDFTLKNSSPCINTGDPTASIGDEAYGGMGRINMGRYGGTQEAAIPSWARVIGYGQQFGYFYGGIVANEEGRIIKHRDEAYLEFQINRIAVAYVNLRGASKAACFTTTPPTGNAAATSVGWRISGKNIEFMLDGVRVCYADDTGGNFG